MWYCLSYWATTSKAPSNKSECPVLSEYLSEHFSWIIVRSAFHCKAAVVTIAVNDHKIIREQKEFTAHIAANGLSSLGQSPFQRRLASFSCGIRILVMKVHTLL